MLQLIFSQHFLGQFVASGMDAVTFCGWYLTCELQLRLLWSIPSAAANIGAVAEVRKRGRGESLRVHLLSLHRGPVTIQSFPFSLVFSSGISRMTALLGVL